MNRGRTALTALCLACLSTTQAIVIDDFSSGFFNITANSSNPMVEAVRTGTMIGGQRDALLRYLGGPLSVNATADGSGVQFFNADSETAGSLTFQYDGFDGELETDGMLTPGTGLDLDLSSDDMFVFDFRFVDAGLGASIGLLTTVVTSSGTFSFMSEVANGTNIHHEVLFSSFAGADFSNVDSIEFTFIGGPAADFTLDMTGTAARGGDAIPGPVAALPFLAGMIGLRRRRR